MTTSQIGWERIARRKNFTSNFNMCLAPTIVNSFPNIEKKNDGWKIIFPTFKKKNEVVIIIIIIYKK